MQAALYDPQDGYYYRQGAERWGRAGDYRTSPERSSLFAATFARYFANLYQQLDQPDQLTIVEMGAGAGYFAEGVLSTLQHQFPEVFAATRYVIDELSPASVDIARNRLTPFHDRVEFSHPNQVETGIVFSNELLDAFPVHRVILKDGELRELYVSVNDSNEFEWTEGALSTPQLSDYFDYVGVHLTQNGQIAEVNLEVRDWLARVATLFDRGYVITVDYGDEAVNLFGSHGRREGTLRGFRRHQFANVLENPGEQDITTTVDWTYVKRQGEAHGLDTISFERLDRFLLSAGILEQLELMTAQTSLESDRASLRAGAREMILPPGMAGSFQVLVQKK
jgi:SAM-dependent MidA family methyltransferase